MNKFLQSINTFCDKYCHQSSDTHDNITFLADNDSLLLISNEKYLSAKLLEKINKSQIYVLSNKKTAIREEMIKHYGFNPIYYDKIKLHYAFLSAIRGMYCCLRHSGQTLLKLDIGGIKCGDLIYDSIIMRGKTYTLDSIKSKSALKEIILMYYTFYCTRRYFKSFKPKLFIAQDLVYRDGFITRYAKNFGCDILVITTGRPSYLVKSSDKSDITFPNLYEREIRNEIKHLPKDWEALAKAELDRLYQGKWDWNSQNAFKGKIILAKEDLLDKLNINNGKKNIVVMSHCFSDATPGNGNGMELYKDYYPWLENTIRIAGKIESVNWLIRPHPSRAHYGEVGGVEELCSKYSNIQIMSDEYSTLMVAEIADCIITVNGSAGLELPCLGIPCVNAGKPFYSSFGFSICPGSISEYEEVLTNIYKIEKLSDKQIKTAQMVLWLFHKIFRVDNGYYDECFKIHQMFCKDGDLKKANQQYSNLFSEYVNNGKMTDTYNFGFANSLYQDN